MRNMVSTRGIKYRFSVGEKVLCYEPDQTKAKVLYDSKVMDIIETKDKKGKRSIEYLIHFQGWNSSWDRSVHEDFVLKDTDKNRQLQRDLAERSQLQIGAYLYRKERKKRKRITSGSSLTEPKTPFRPSSDDGSSCCSSAAGGFRTEESDFLDSSHNIDPESESCSSSVESVNEEDRVALQISEKMKNFLEYDQKMITKMGKLVILPAKIPVVTILENFVKYYSIKSICEPNSTDAPRRRNSVVKSERKEKDYEKIKNSINLRKEAADGLRIYFDFLLRDFLLYNQEREQGNVLLSEENLKNFTYVGSDWQSLDVILSLKQGTPNTPFSSSELSEPHVLQPQTSVDTSISEDNTAKRRLRSHKTTGENEFIFDFGAVATKNTESILSTSSGGSTPYQNPQMCSLNLLRSLLPTNMAVTSKTRELLQNVLAWQILPSDAPAEPSMIYGSVHLCRLIVKLPDFLNAVSMPDEKLKLLLQNLDAFIEFLETHKEWFGEHQYRDANGSDQYCMSPVIKTEEIEIKTEL